MANTMGYSRRMGVPLLVAAASHKMTALVRAMRTTGANVWLVSIPVLGQTSSRRFAAGVVLRDDDGTSVFLPSFANRWLRKLFAPLTFGWFCARYVRREDRVVLYNHALEYLPGLLVLRMKGVRTFLDIEDAPRDDEVGPIALALRGTFRLSFWLTESRKITASRELAARLSISDSCVVYSATTGEWAERTNTREALWSRIEGGAPLRVHFGGSLCRDTGLSVFCDAAKLLAATLRSDTTRICFHVTGSGGEAELTALQKDLQTSRVQLLWRRNLPKEVFLSDFLECHAALSLRIPGSLMSETTFPSKVVEITENGLLLIATRASDVPLLFDETNSVLLDRPIASELAERIKGVLDDVEGMRLRAVRGQQRAFEIFDERAVGERLVKFLDVAPTERRRGTAHSVNA
ncbi:MAG: hypothetical protein LC136_13245 [Burkholderiales bacterium]|nr:hypothetical protein [Burkholderiales bacterium]